MEARAGGFVDFSRLDRTRVLIGGIAATILLLSLLFLPWYTVDLDVPNRQGSDAAANFICGVGDSSCTGFETFPIMRWFLLAGCFAPLILAWIIIRGHRLSWAPGEMTMVAGFTMAVLIFYNGILDKPGSGTAEVGVSLDYGYFLALLASIAIAATGFLRSQAGQKRQRKAPGTV